MATGSQQPYTHTHAWQTRLTQRVGKCRHPHVRSRKAKNHENLELLGILEQLEQLEGQEDLAKLEGDGEVWDEGTRQDAASPDGDAGDEEEGPREG